MTHEVGRYQIVTRIGGSATGDVFRARDPLLGREVALKAITPALAADPGFRERFQREIQAAAALDHPNVATIFDFGQDAGTGIVFIAMELFEGRDLRHVIRTGALSTFEHRLDLMQQMAEGLAHAHSRGVVHRDLKPGNVLVQPDGGVKLVDFGLAPSTAEATRTGTPLGMPHYLSPEQVRELPSGPRSDVFALGAIFYEVLTGRRAFDAPSLHELLQAILEHEPEPVRRHAPQTPHVVAALVERAMSKDAAARPADAGEVVEQLAAARASLPRQVLARDPEATTIGGFDLTVLPAPQQMPAATEGATALSLHRLGRPEGSTLQPAPTLSPAGQPRAATGRPRTLAIAGVLALVLGGAAGIGWWARSRPHPDAGREQLARLTATLVAAKVELAQAHLDSREYAAAAERAREALALDAGNSTAREVLRQAGQAEHELQQAVAAARGALARGDRGTASAALGRVLSLDPHSPAVSEMSSQLDRHFRAQADEARREARSARVGAETAAGTSPAALAPLDRLAAEGDELYRQQRFAAAAQKYAESRSGFDAVRREAQAGSALAALRAAEEQARQRVMEQEASQQEASQQEASRQEASRQEASRQEAARQEASTPSEKMAGATAATSVAAPPATVSESPATVPEPPVTVGKAAPPTAATEAAAPAPAPADDSAETSPLLLQPPALIASTPPRYPAQARSLKVGGVVETTALVDQTGTVSDVRIIRADPAGVGFEEAALEHVRSRRYRPALRGGVAIPMRVPVVVTFRH